jgi:hypothetical protein
MKQISNLKSIFKGIKKQVQMYDPTSEMFSAFYNCTIELDSNENKIIIHEKYDEKKGAYGSLSIFKINSIANGEEENSKLIKIEAGNMYEHQTILLEIINE